MPVNALLAKSPLWVTEASPDSGMALFCQCALARNLADFPFPFRCSEEEKQAVENRVVHALDTLGLFAHGRYYSLPALEPREIRFLAERRLITYELFAARGPRGVYVSDDQVLSIMVNGVDHVGLRVLLPGMQCSEAWAQLNLIDDTLSGLLDYAFNERLGFLTTELGSVGTGLKASVLLHLPGLAQNNQLTEFTGRATRERLRLRGMKIGPGPDARAVATPEYLLNQVLFADMNGAVSCPAYETVGALFVLVNVGALGASEEEIVFRVRHAAADLLAAEKAARIALSQEGARGLEDTVGRARGIAGGARLLDFGEALELLSALRLGIDMRLQSGIQITQLNELMIGAQGAHLTMTNGHHEDPLTLSVDRAALFRGIFGN